MFGIIQGRLTVPPSGELQCFPTGAWQNEFLTAKQLNYHYIELITEEEFNAENPIWSDVQVDMLKALSAETGLSLYSVCNDFIIKHNLSSDKAALENAIQLIDQCEKLKVALLVFPMFGASLLTESNAKQFRPVLTRLCDYAKQRGVLICLETVLPAKPLSKLLNEIGKSNIAYTFDFGNRVAAGFDLEADIADLADFIKHVHIKDKNSANENVLLGTGKANFLNALKALSKINYKGGYTFETVRGVDPIDTAKMNKAYISFLMAQLKETCL